MGRKTPEVVTGLRGPTGGADNSADSRPVSAVAAESELQGRIESIAANRTSVSRREGEVVFTSKARRYRFQVTAPGDKYDPATGIRTPARPIVAQFDEHTYRTSDPFIIGRLKGDRAFGIGRDYWDSEEFRQESLKRSISALVEQLSAIDDEEVKRQVIERLQPTGKSEFEVAQKEA